MTPQARDSGIPSRELFEKNPLPMWVFDLETLAFLAVNDAAVHRYGYSRREFLAMTIKEIRPPEEIPALLDRVSQRISGYSQAGTWKHRTKDGTVIDVEITTQTLRFAGRKAKLVLAHDVTERKRLEQDLQAAAEQWRRTFDAISDAVALVDRDGTIVRCNAALTALSQREYPDIIGRPWWEITHGTPELASGSPLQEAMATRARSTTLVAAGSRLFEVAADPLIDEGGEFAGAVLIFADVTPRVQAEKILHDLVLQQEAILNNIPDLAWLKDDQDRFLAVNEPFERACGHTAADLVGKTDLDIWPRELAERYRADDAEVMRSRKRKVVEEPLADKAGNAVWIETIKTPIVDEAGRVVGTTGIARDITARRRAEDALRRKDHLLSEAQRIGHIGSWEADFKTGRVVWSEEMHRIYGTSPATFVPTAASYLRMIHPRDRKAMVQWIRATTAGERLENLEFRFVRPDGAERWLRGSIEPLLDAAGQPTGAIGTGQDITESKKKEEVLQASERKFRTLFEAANDAIFIVDLQGRLIDVNTVAHERLGYTREEMLSKTVMELDPPEFAARVPERIEQIRKFGKAVFETAHVRKDGTVMPVEINARAVESDGRKVLYSIVRDISARKKAESEIAQSQARYRDLFENASDAIFLLDSQQRYLDANRRAEELTGYTVDELKTMGVIDMVPPGQVAASTEEFKKLETQGSYERFEGRLRRKDGALIDIEVSSSAIVKDGVLVGSRDTVRDVTERKRLEEQIYRSSHDWEETFNTITDMVTVHDRDFNIVRANKAAEKILGLPFLEVKHVKCFEYFHGTACPPAGCPSCASLVTGKPSVNEIFEPHLGRHLEIRAIPRLDSNNHVVGLIHVVRDISERKKNEDALAEYSRELAALNTASNTLIHLTKLQDLYQEICDIMMSVFTLRMVWLGSVEAREHAVRPLAHAGHEEGYLAAIRIRWDDSPLSLGPTGRAVKTRAARTAQSTDPDFAPWRAEAERRGFLAVMAVPLINTSNVCIGALTFYSDNPQYFTPDRIRMCQIFANQAAIAIENARLIEGLENTIAVRTRAYESANAELHTLNRELEVRRREAESASRTKSDFLANMSHELRTPLNAIIGFSDLMARGLAGPLAEKQREYLVDILSGGRHLLSLINDILDLSKVEAGKMELEPAAFDLADLIDRSLILFREKAVKHRLDLRREVPGPIAPVLGDERKIRQVLYNLLSNAVKFTPDGGSVIVRARAVRGEDREFVEISVADTGIGISPEDQARLFLPFSQLGHHLTKNQEGTGLGLALCKSFVEMHGGRIHVESVPGRGSTFTFRIPLRFEKGVS